MTGNRVARIAARGLLLLSCLCLPVWTQRNTFSVCFESVGCFSKNGTFKDAIQELPIPPEQMQTNFVLFTRQNQEEGQSLDYLDEDSVSTTLFDPLKTLYVWVHGYGNSVPFNTPLKPALLEQYDCQVLIVDWRGGSFATHWQSAVNTELVGRQLAKLIDLLKTKRSMDPSRVHLVGFSLGAQVVGFAGKWTRDQYGYLLGRITALDPASEYFEDYGPTVHVWKDDAEFVDAVHSAAGRDMLLGKVGMEKAIGHVDFYPNGGSEQPGCPQSQLNCSHIRAREMFFESIKSRCYFESFPCSDGYEAFRRGQCSECGSQGCGRMGMPSKDAPGSGVQYLDTNGSAPFCKTA